MTKCRLNIGSYFILVVRLCLHLLVTTLVCAASVQAADRPADEIHIGGTGAALGTIQKLADGFKTIAPQAKVKIFGVGSEGGIKAALAGALDIGVSSRPLTEAEKAKGGKDLAISSTPFVLATRLDNSISGLTLKELTAIYAGTMTAWPNASQIRVVLRPEYDPDSTLLRKISPELGQAVDMAQAREGMKIATTDRDIATDLENIPGAIGTATLALIVTEERRLKPLALNGVVPSLSTLADGTYPHKKQFYFVTLQSPSSLAQAFVDFVRSPAGTKILVQSGNLVAK